MFVSVAKRDNGYSPPVCFNPFVIFLFDCRNSMMSETQGKPSLPTSISFNAEIEMELCIFYTKILKELYVIYGHKFSRMHTSLRVIRSYRNPDIEKRESVSFENEYDRLAYIFAYGVIHSSIMYDHFSRMLLTNRRMGKKIMSMKMIKLCILGGGPSSEIISVCKLFNNIMERSKPVRNSPLQMHITVVDNCIGWKKDATLMVTSALNDLYDPINVEVHFSFLEADLKADFPEDVKKELKTSHFVTMFQCLTNAHYTSYSDPEISDIMNRTLEAMSYKACLFFLNTSGGGYFNGMDKMIDRLPHAARIFGPSRYESHFLDIDTLKAFSDTLSSTFLFLRCTVRSTFSSSAWMKTRNVVKIQKEFSKLKEELYETSADSEKHILKEKRRKNRMKRIVQTPARFRELFCDDVENDKLREEPYDTSADSKKRILKKKRRKNRMKRVVQTPAKFRELFYDDVENYNRGNLFRGNFMKKKPLAKCIASNFVVTFNIRFSSS